MRAGGKDQVLFSSANTVDGLRQAQARVNQMETDKARELERKYGIQIAGPNETVTADKNNPNVPCRQPNLAELTALEAALSKGHMSAPGQMPLKVYFLAKQVGPIGDLAEYKPNVNGQPAIILNLSASLSPPTERDAKTPNSSMEATFLHELTHNQEHSRLTNGLPPLRPPELPGDLVTPERPRILPEPSADAFQKDKQLYEQMGWRSINGRWVIEGADGDLYRYLSAEGNLPRRWMRVTEQGQPADASGRPTQEASADFRTNEQMRQIARVAPASDYFRQPHEIYAEGLQLLRTNAASRAALLQASPQLYQLMKHKDQEAINQQYPPAADGQPTFIRRPDGAVVPNTKANQIVVAAFENRNRIRVP